MNRSPLLIAFVSFLSAWTTAQPGFYTDTSKIIFRDTFENFVFDSLKHDLGVIDPSQTRMKKYFKYIGSDTILFTRAFTSDPHFIGEYPKGPLVPGRIYSITIAFYHRGKMGRMSKVMGLRMSNGKQIMWHFRGEYPPPDRKE